MINALKKIRNIIIGWWFVLINKTPDYYNERVAICSKCEHIIKLTKNESMCDSCGCIIRAKARVKNEKCNLNKW